MASLTPLRIISAPGIKRDGTRFDGKNYIDGKWFRFQRGLPRKIRGYRSVWNTLTGPVRGLYDSATSAAVNIHSGSAGDLERIQIDPTTATPIGGIYTRTPAAFVLDENNQWSFDSMFNQAVGADNVALLAHAAPNALDIQDETNQPIYYGDINDTTPLLPITTMDPANRIADVSGGVVVAQPYAIRYGNAGFVGWSIPNDPTDTDGPGSGEARVVADKIVNGKKLRAGAASAPAVLLWSLNSLVAMSFSGGATVFNFDTISSEISIIARNSVIEYDGIYFWIGDGRFFRYDGVVQPLINEMSTNWFFDNLTQGYANKIYAMKNQRWNEIWWCAPMFGATECSHALIYNVNEGLWYDTVLPNGGRTSATNQRVTSFPYMVGAVETGPSKYRLWQHEYGVDEVVQTNPDPIAIQAYITTADVNLPLGIDGRVQPMENSLILNTIEPDMVQVGDMTVIATGRTYAMQDGVELWRGTFNPATTDPDNPSTFVMWPKTTRRLVNFTFETNVAGGDLQFGETLMDIQPGDRKK